MKRLLLFLLIFSAASFATTATISYPANSSYNLSPIVNITCASPGIASWNLNLTDGATYLLTNQKVIDSVVYTLNNTSFDVGTHILNATCQNASTVSSITKTFTMNTVINLYCYAEISNNSSKSFTGSVQSNTNYIPIPTSTVYSINSSLLGAPPYQLHVDCTSGTSRLYLLGITSGTFDAWSLNSTLGASYQFTVKDAYGVLLPNVTISAYRFNNYTSTSVLVEQGITDFTGSTILFLQTPNIVYNLVVNANGYAALALSYVPGVTTISPITLVPSGAQYLQLPNWNYEVNDISWSLLPTNLTVYNATNLSFQISAANSDLVYFGMNVSMRNLLNYSNQTLLCNQTISSSPAGGIIWCNITQMGYYTIQPFWKVTNYSERLPMATFMTYSNATMMSDAFATFQKYQPIGTWGFYAIGLVIAMIVGGYVSKYTIDGAGLASVATLWFFTFFFVPTDCIALVGIFCITPMATTILTTITVVATLYLVKYL
jgi:hypothetical protein